MVKLRIYHDGDKFWLYNNRTHRIDGPAILWKDGPVCWFWYGQPVSEFEHMMLVAQEQTSG